MSPKVFFDEVDLLYNDAEKIYEKYQRPNLYRARQHSVSSLAEDLMAAFLYDNLKPYFRGVDLYFMVDYPIQPNNQGSLIIPDLAIIVERNIPLLVSYLDIKTDLGYKRDYFNRLPAIVNCIQRLRSAKAIKKTTNDGRAIAVSDNLIWRTVVLSDENIHRDLLARNKKEAVLHSPDFKLYFLSGNKHPNAKNKSAVKIYTEVFQELIHDIRMEIQEAVNLA